MCKKIALNLDRDDFVTTVATTFLSVTLHCARCHDHKFDPLTQEDYYGLQAVFSGIIRGERTYGPVEQSRMVRKWRRHATNWPRESTWRVCRSNIATW